MSLVFWRRARRVVQAFAFFGALALVIVTTRHAWRGIGADTLMHLDPLAGLAAMLAARRWLGRFILGLSLLALTLLAGRFWCGWLCPVGTLLDWIGPRRRRQAPAPRTPWRRVKYGLLFVILFAALWGNLTLLVLDPITLFIRTVGTVILPGVNWLVVQAEGALYRIPWLVGATATVDGALQGTLLSYKQPHYAGAALLGAVFSGVLLLNLWAPRAWCRYFCPLGGLYALVSKVSWLKRKVSPACVRCGACERGCPMGTVDSTRAYASDSGECTLCLDCAVECPKGAISFGGDVRPSLGWPYDPSRRQALGTFAASIGGMALLKIGARGNHPHPYRLRPPGAEEKTLLSRCIRCGACLRACPSHGLQPALAEAGLEGIWTPILVPRLGPCEYSCHTCGQVCPTGAIPRLPLEEKRLTPIGKAYIDPALCIAWSGRGPCIVCEEMCPLPQKAITLVELPAGPAEQPITIQAPVVNHERCIGCGLCEFKCPVQGEAAIRVRIDPMG
ncbi:MAG: 4Fe-4S binding protein [Chloroflexi bacterium]|nr:4Fe-4S binding protein [Chloroflexota bacterium]